MLVWIQIEEQMKTGEEERNALETEREELHNQLQLSKREVSYYKEYHYICPLLFHLKAQTILNMFA